MSKHKHNKSPTSIAAFQQKKKEESDMQSITTFEKTVLEVVESNQAIQQTEAEIEEKTQLRDKALELLKVLDVEEPEEPEATTADLQDLGIQLQSTPENTDQTTSPLLKRAAELVAETTAHPLVRDKSPAAIAKKVAQALNRENFAPPQGSRFWQTASVLMLLDPAGSSILTADGNVSNNPGTPAAKGNAKPKAEKAPKPERKPLSAPPSPDDSDEL